jgi:Tfp pilus assembly protein PilO
MKASSLHAGLWRTRADIGVWRHGWIWPLVIALGILVLALRYLWWPQQQLALHASQANLTTTQQRLLKLNTTPPPPIVAPVSDAQTAWASLDGHTVSDVELSAVVRRITTLANTQGLVLAQSEFQNSNDGHGGLRQVQITLPVRASYPQVRVFVETILRQLPMVSVDQLAMKRESVALAQVEVRLKLSVWVNPLKNTSATSRSTDATDVKVKQP